MGKISTQNRHDLVFMHHWRYVFITSLEGQGDGCGLLTMQRPDRLSLQGDELVLYPWQGPLREEGKSLKAQAGSRVFIRDVPV